VTAVGPWAAVRAAAYPSDPAVALDPAAAFAAHTAGGWRAAGRPGEGGLAPGAPATFAVWSPTDLGPDGLPNLSPGADLPSCVCTVRRGEIIHTLS